MKKFRKMYKNNSPTNKYFLFVVIFIVFSIMLVTIGYSAFNANLSVEEVLTKIRAQKDARIISNNIKSVSEGTIVTYTEFNVESTSHGIMLPNSDSYAIFDIGLVNLGNVTMAINSISGINEGLKYEIVNDDFEGYNSYQEGQILCDDDNSNLCKLGIEKHILIKISYDSEESFNNASSNTFNINLKYDIDTAKYRVSFDKNNADAIGEMEDIVVEYEEEFNLPANLYSLESYYLKGWSLNPDGTGTLYHDMANVSGLASTGSNSVVLYAIWTIKKYNITYESEFVKLMTNDGPSEIIDGHRLELDVDVPDNAKLSVVMNREILQRDVDYTVEDGKLVIEHVTGDVKFDVIIPVVNQGVSTETEWIDNYTAYVTLNGRYSGNDLYMRLYKNDVKIESSGAALYVKEYAENPMLKYYDPSDEENAYKNNIFVEYEYIDGTVTFAKNAAFTIKLRDATRSCAALKTAEYITNNTSNNNFNIYESTRKEGVLTQSISYISVFSKAGNTFNNFKFKVTYGVVEKEG